MSMRLARLRDEVRHELGQTGAISQVDDAAIDHALMQGLMLLAGHYPTVRETVTVTTTGNTQNLAELAPTMLRVESVQYPYDPDYPQALVYSYSIIGAQMVLFHAFAPQAGEQMLLHYKARHTIAGLGLAENDTLPETPAYEHPLVLAAAAHLLEHTGARTPGPLDKDMRAADDRLRGIAENMTNQAIDAAINLGAPVQNPVWSRLGL